MSAVTAPRASSACNRMTGAVVPVERDSVMAKVEMTCRDYRIVSLMSHGAADELGLERGVPATAVVKATHVISWLRHAAEPDDGGQVGKAL